MKIKQQIKNTIKEYPKYNKANITYSYTILEQYHFEKRDENGNTQRVIDFVKNGIFFGKIIKRKNKRNKIQRLQEKISEILEYYKYTPAGNPDTTVAFYSDIKKLLEDK